MLGALSGLRHFLAKERPLKGTKNAMICAPDCDLMNFEVNLIFLIKPFSLHDQKVMAKT